MYQVTYLNPLTQARAVLIDRLEIEVAEQVKQKYSDKNQPMFFLPDVRIEQQAKETAA
jgi:hypothetical protein